MTPDKPGKRNDGAADPDASDLDGLIAERDRVRAELERLRREKREAEIELSILKGALELVGKERGADPDNLTNREKTILVKAVSAGHGIPAERLLARVGLARSTYYHQSDAMNRPDRDEGLLALVRDVFENSLRRYGYRRVWLEPRKRRDRRVRQKGHAADDAARARPLAQAGPALQLVQGRADQGAGQPRQSRFPCRGTEPAVGHGPDGVLHPRGQGLPQPGDRLLRRDAGGLDDRHEPERRAGQPDAPRRVRHARGRGASGHPLRPRLPLPVARVDQCLWSNKAVRCRHLFWTVMAFILDSVGGRHRCDMRAPVPLVS